MNPFILSLINTLEALGVKFRASQAHIVWEAPPGVMTSRHLAFLKKFKFQIIRLLHLREQGQYLQSIQNKIVLGDCMNVLQKMSENSIDTIICDGPFGWEFMGKNWDKAVPGVEVWKECLRVLKPGSFAFIMSGPRQDGLERMIANLREAGFKIHFTSLYWTYATGFPKINKTVTQHDVSYSGFQPKPAVEVILVVMKPLQEKTYKKQTAENGKGCTWMDDCRIPYDDGQIPSRDLVRQKSSAGGQVPASEGECWDGHSEGRFPANLLVSDDVLDDGKNHKGNGKVGWTKLAPCISGFGMKPLGEKTSSPNNEGGYSRFFSLDSWAERNLPFLIVPKASKIEKNAGLDGFEEKTVSDGRKSPNDTAFQRGVTPRKNTHPCTKPVKLMSYLISMGSRPGDLILDPFCGSGTTCVAAKLLDRRFIGIEKEEEYQKIAVARVKNASQEVLVLKRAVSDIKKHEESREQQEDDCPIKAPEPCFFSNKPDDYWDELLKKN